MARLVALVLACLAALTSAAAPDEPSLQKMDEVFSVQGRELRGLKNVIEEDTGLKINTPIGKQGCEQEWCRLDTQLEHSDALFGIPPYGGEKKITGRVYYVTPGNETGCGAYDPNFHVEDDLGGTAIFLVDRGSCNFVNKVRNAENKGALAVIIADNQCRCADAREDQFTPEFTKVCQDAIAKSDKRQCESMIPFMADDLSGSDIRIPSFLISMWDAQRLKDCYLTSTQRKGYTSVSGVTCEPGTPIQTTLQWGMPSPDGIVEWELWTSSDTEHTFKSKFKNFATSSGLYEHTTFTPHYMTYDVSQWCNKLSSMTGTECAGVCYNKKYCHPDPDCPGMTFSCDDAAKYVYGVSGSDVVEENLRQLCVWQKANETYAQDGGAVWWNYVTRFDELCHGRGRGVQKDTFNAACSQRVHDEVPGLDWQDTLRCIERTTKADGTNSLLEDEMLYRKQLNIMADPTVIVNNVIERGTVNTEAVSQTICAGFLSGTEPELCQCMDENYGQYGIHDALEHCKCKRNPDKPEYCARDGGCYATKEECYPSGIKPWEVVVIVLVVTGVLAAGGFVYWRRAKQQMRDEVRNILAQYMPLEDVPKSGGGGGGLRMARMKVDEDAEGDDVGLI